MLHSPTRLPLSLSAAFVLAVVSCAPAAPAPVSAPVSIEVTAPSASASAVRVLPAPSPSATVVHRDPPPAEDNVLITVLTRGTGPEALPTDFLLVNYVGTLLDGTEFDSTLKPGRQPFKFKLGQGYVIKGWEQGLLGMHVGERRKIVIPPSLAYGEHGRPPTIPASATIVFEVELVAINPP